MTRVSNNLLKDAGTTGKALLTATTAAAARTTLGLATVASTGNYNDLINKPSGGGSFAGTYHSVEFVADGTSISFYGIFPDGIGDLTPPTNSSAYVVSVGGVHQPPSAYTISYMTNNTPEKGLITFGEVIPSGLKVSVQVTF